MCTAILLVGVGPDHPVVVAANRDEFRSRPAVGPVELLDHPRAVGGRDEAGGGSWLGVTDAGFLALLTNQPEPGGPRAAARTRGEIVVEVLRRGGAAGARAYLAALDATAYNSFNLLYGDTAGLEVAYGRADRRAVEREVVPPGLHILPNGRLDDPGLRKVARARSLIEPHLGAAWPALSAHLAAALADHDRPDLADLPQTRAGDRFPRELVRELHALCIHTPEYGTRSAAIIALDPGRVAHLLWAPGPPCTTAFAGV
ncbi:MAG TPA: NRDE family protein [Kofleriaceae bacterium]|nr:NRDE family protein [Kofleriaceae bacterium]